MAEVEASRLSPTQPIPPAALVRRVGCPANVDPAAWYVESGAAHKQSIVRLLPADWTWSGKRVLDFGCGIGRILAQFTAEARQTACFAGCDIDGPSIEWLSVHLAPPFEMRHTQEDPPLP